MLILGYMPAACFKQLGMLENAQKQMTGTFLQVYCNPNACERLCHSQAGMGVSFTSYHCSHPAMDSELGTGCIVCSIINCRLSFAGKHVRVWTGSRSAVLHRSPPLYSVLSASSSSLTRAPLLLTSFISLGLGSDLLKVASNNNNNKKKNDFFDVQRAHSA